LSSKLELKLRSLIVWFVSAPKFVVRMQDDMTRWKTKCTSAQLLNEFSRGGPDYRFNFFWTTRIAFFETLAYPLSPSRSFCAQSRAKGRPRHLRVVRTNMKCLSLVGRPLLLRTSKLRSRSQNFLVDCFQSRSRTQCRQTFTTRLAPSAPALSITGEGVSVETVQNVP
jgi:hypothetical protein